MDNDYWQKQTKSEPLFDDVLWSKPERRDQAGRLTIVGGSDKGFLAVANAYEMGLKAGAGMMRVIMPDALKRKLPTIVAQRIDDLIFTESNPSGGFARGTMPYLQSAGEWSGNMLFIGDNGANAETSGLFEAYLLDDKSATTTITRDAVDSITNGAETVLNRPQTNLVVSLSQLQKLARAVYYPRMITFSMGIKQAAETLHKLTITYPVTITLFHDNNLFVAQNGQVISQAFDQPMRVWSGEIAVQAATWSVWVKDLLKATATSWTEL